MLVKNMKSSNGNPVLNQFIIREGGKLYFQSYQTVIAVIEIENGQVTLDKNGWKYSRTTVKYRNQFLGENSNEIEAKVKSGEYKLDNLN